MLCHSSINQTEWCQRRVTCQQLIGYINAREKIRYFFTCVVTAFLRARNIFLFAGWEVRLVKNCDRGLENAVQGRRPRAAFSRRRSQFFVIWTNS